jgi:hypothetical protein
MKELFRDFLFNKNILVADRECEDKELSSLLCTALMSKYGYNVVKGNSYMSKNLFTYVASKIDNDPVEPFYRGFPESVEKLCPEEFLFDQLFSYYKSYGLGDFSEEQHSVLEESVKRIALLKSFTVKNIVILDEEAALEKLTDCIKDTCKGSRPLNESQYQIVLEFIKEYRIFPEIKSSNTSIRLLIDTKCIYISDNLNLNEFPKFVEELNYRVYSNKDIKKINLKNQDRKFLKNILNRMLSVATTQDVIQCIEKRRVWKGILHHLHYNNDKLQNIIYRDYLKSHTGVFEMYLNEGNVIEGIDYLKETKGASAVMRNADYILSKCNYSIVDEVIDRLVEIASESNTVVLLQMISHYNGFERGIRNYSFTKFNLKKNHIQTTNEHNNSKTVGLSDSVITKIYNKLKETLYNKFKGRVNKIYIDPLFKKIALPLDMAASNGGVGSLPSGSRITIPEGAIIRAFTYWEKVNDIDLSAMLYDEDMNVAGEFSWRSYTANGAASSGFIFSGDQTCGYKGGSEYFDFKLETIQKNYPRARYIVLNNNVFSGINFSECYCKAGFMLRDKFKSGEVFEPKTVQTSYLVNAQSTFCHLFAIDMKTRELIWLNVNKNSKAIVGGTESGAYLKKYMKLTESLNIYDAFSHMGSKVDSIDECRSERDLILTPDRVDIDTKAELITLQDLEKLNKYIED